MQWGTLFFLSSPSARARHAAGLIFEVRGRVRCVISRIWASLTMFYRLYRGFQNLSQRAEQGLVTALYYLENFGFVNQGCRPPHSELPRSPLSSPSRARCAPINLAGCEFLRSRIDGRDRNHLEFSGVECDSYRPLLEERSSSARTRTRAASVRHELDAYAVAIGVLAKPTAKLDPAAPAPPTEFPK
jgi:hypothetical protein